MKRAGLLCEIERLRRELERKGKPGDLRAGEVLRISRRLDAALNRYLTAGKGGKGKGFAHFLPPG